MKSLKAKYFLIYYAIFLLLGAIILLSFDKTQIHIFINKHYSHIADIFFKYITNLGNSIALLILIIILLFVRYKYAFAAFMSGIFTGIIVQSLKRIFFSGTPRPVLFFQNKNIHLHLIAGVKMAMINSFPSGHSTTAFVIFLTLSLIIENFYWQTLFFIFALLVAFSRVYLSQHFFLDIYAGSIIGVSITIIIFEYVNKLKNSKLDEKISLK
jgi:membrane-associated phospholipid phosphatase